MGIKEGVSDCFLNVLLYESYFFFFFFKKKQNKACEFLWEVPIGVCLGCVKRKAHEQYNFYVKCTKTFNYYNSDADLHGPYSLIK